MYLSFQKTLHNFRSISSKISLFTNQNWFIMFSPVLRLKLLLVCPGHIFFVSLEFSHLFTALTSQLTPRALGVNEGRQPRHGSILSVFDVLSAHPKSLHLIPEVLVPSTDAAMLISAISVLFQSSQMGVGVFADYSDSQ